MHWADALKVLQIILIDIVLSGDNAVVIAMAAHKLPIHQRKKAILWGGGIAIAMRIAFTMIMAFLLMVPGLRMIGGLVLVWIACKLLIGEEDEELETGSTDRSTLAAIKMIFLADFVMSLDNMLAVAGASHGNALLLLFGLLVSIGIIMFCSSLIAQLMNRYHWIVYLGAAILAWTAGEMMMGDRELASYFVRSRGVSLSSHWDEWMETHGHVDQFAGVDQLSDDLRKRVHFTPPAPGALWSSDGKLRFIGQMTAAERDELQSLVSTEKEKDEIGEMYEKSHLRDVPDWVPDGLRERVQLWFQSKWPARDYFEIEGRRYPWVAWIVQSAVVVFCLLAPRFFAGRKEADGGAAEPQETRESNAGE